MREQLLQEAFNLLVYGLSTVFIFLCLLIFLTIIMSKIVLSIEATEVFKEKGCGNISNLNHFLAVKNIIRKHSEKQN